MHYMSDFDQWLLPDNHELVQKAIDEWILMNPDGPKPMDPDYEPGSKKQKLAWYAEHTALYKNAGLGRWVHPFYNDDVRELMVEFPWLAHLSWRKLCLANYYHKCANLSLGDEECTVDLPPS